VFNLSTWSSKWHSLGDWLVAELNTKYQVPKAIAQPWVTQQQLLLLLDGLDEVRANYRDACVVALNQFQQAHGTEMVVCSRIKDYEGLSHRLTVQQAIYLRSLLPTQIDQYFSQLNANLIGLRQLLQEDTALQELAKSPLMLNILILAYEGIDPQDFLKSAWKPTAVGCSTPTLIVC
jgi:predicted NACHT family NTPase